MTRTIGAAALLAVALLAGCDQPKTSDPRISERLADGEVAQVAIAPDGTVLWAVRRNGSTIYFASSGTRRTEGCGKHCTRDEYVPSAGGQRQ